MKDDITRLAQAAFNIRYEDFLAALGISDSTYARDKYDDLKKLGRAMALFDDASLRKIIEAYEAERAARVAAHYDRKLNRGRDE